MWMHSFKLFNKLLIHNNNLNCVNNNLTTWNVNGGNVNLIAFIWLFINNLICVVNLITCTISAQLNLDVFFDWMHNIMWLCGTLTQHKSDNNRLWPIIGRYRLYKGRYQLSANWSIIDRYRLSADNRCISKIYIYIYIYNIIYIYIIYIYIYIYTISALMY